MSKDKRDWICICHNKPVNANGGCAEPLETNEATEVASFVGNIHRPTPNYTPTNEAPVESVSQPKAVDGYLKEFDELFPDGVMIEYDEKTDAWEIDVTKKVKSFLKSSIERARREGGVEAIEMMSKDEKDGGECVFCKEYKKDYLKMWREK